jgi:hypothetical protein
MTERLPRRRASKRELRAWAWIAGGLAFAVPWAALGAAPKPPSVQASAADSQRPVVIVRKITRRVIVSHPSVPAPVRYVTAPSSSNGSGSGTSAAPPPPATSTGAS